jgi:hypothetical protein
MALRALNITVAANYAKLSTDPVLAGDIVAFNLSANSLAVNPACVARAGRGNGSANQTSVPPAVTLKGQIIGVCADDALGTNPSGETPTMINNDPAGSNFVNGSAFQTYTNGFYVGVKRAISDFKDESVDVVTNLTAGVPLYSQRGVSVYTTPSSQFVTDRFALVTAQNAGVDAVNWTGSTGSTTPQSGDLLTVGANQGTGGSAATANGNYPVQPTVSTASNTTNNSGLLVSAGSSPGAATPVIGRVDYYDSGAGLLYWTLV